MELRLNFCHPISDVFRKNGVQVTIWIKKTYHGEVYFLVSFEIPMMILSSKLVKRCSTRSHHSHHRILFLFWFFVEIELVLDHEIMAERSTHTKSETLNRMHSGNSHSQILDTMEQHLKGRNKIQSSVWLNFFHLDIIFFINFFDVCKVVAFYFFIELT